MSKAYTTIAYGVVHSEFKIVNVMVDKAAAVAAARTIARKLAEKPFNLSDFASNVFCADRVLDGVDLLEVKEPPIGKFMNSCFSLKVVSKLNPDHAGYETYIHDYLEDQPVSVYLESWESETVDQIDVIQLDVGALSQEEMESIDVIGDQWLAFMRRFGVEKYVKWAAMQRMYDRNY